MKILYIVPSLDSKAPVMLARNLAEYCLSRGDEVFIYYFDDIIKVSTGCKIGRISIKVPIDFDSFDVIHTHGYRPDKYIYSFRKLIKRAKLISTVHCDIYTDLKYLYGSLASSFFTKRWLKYLSVFDTVVQINDYLLEKNKLKNNVLIYNGISLENENMEIDALLQNEISEFREKNKKILCTYCAIQKRKGIHQIIKALPEMGDYVFICIGSGKEKSKLEKLVKKYNISDRVYFHPFINNPYNILPLVDIFTIPSYSEGFSLALLEAGLKGSSVLCSDIPSFSVPFSRNEVTFFKLDDIESLKEACLEAYEKRDVKGNKLKQRINRDFSEELMLQNYYKLYSSD